MTTQQAATPFRPGQDAPPWHAPLVAETVAAVESDSDHGLTADEIRARRSYCRSDRRSALSFSLFKNPWLIGGLVVSNVLHIAVLFWTPLAEVFHTVTIDLREVLAIGAVASLVLWVEELRKLFVRRRDRRLAREAIR